MTEMILSLFDPNTLLPHRAEIAGLALALSVLSVEDAPLTWEVTEDEVRLAWEVSDREAIEWLRSNTYQIEDGYLNVPALNLEEQGRYTFTQGVTSTLLQHSKQRQLASSSQPKTFSVDEGQPEIAMSASQLCNEHKYSGPYQLTRANFGESPSGSKMTNGS